MFSLLLALSLMFSSSFFLQGLGEERESRLIEVLVSSVSVRQLLTGKILGLGLAGLLQVAVWLVAAPLLFNLSSSALGGLLSGLQIPAHFLVLGILYFIFGYFLFAVLSICIGSISPNAREGQQLVLILSILVSEFISTLPGK